MRQFTLELQERTQRPVVYLANFYGFDAMLDTGALFPIWIENEIGLKKLGAKLVSKNVEFSGFGGRAFGNLYCIPFVQIGELIFPNLHIISCRLNLPCKMILSATMFRGLIYEVDDYNYKLNVTVPEGQSLVRNLVIWDEKGRLHVMCTSGEESL